MIIKTKKVYYCEYCGRHRLVPLLKHEKHCTSNSDRECRLCERTESVKPLIEKYKKQCLVRAVTVLDKFIPSGQKVIKQPDIEDIIDEVDGCPNCTLTIIKGLNIKFPIEIKFDYMKELQQWWDDKNADQGYPEDY